MKTNVAPTTSLNLDLADDGVALGERSRAGAAEAPSRLADLGELTKLRLNFLVLVTTAVGFYMGARPGADWLTLLHALIGTALSAAAASVLNQLIERRADALMPRTRNRPIPAGRVQPIEALILGVVLGATGLAYLARFVNPLTAELGAMTILSYLALYTPAKRVTTLNTVIGAIPGAIPPMMGWTAATGTLGLQAWALFGILFFWQMPHFLAIAILYRADYAQGGFKMLPVLDAGLVTTSRQILFYGMALIPVSLMPTVLGLSSPLYFVCAMLLGLGFLSFGISCATTRTRSDARKLFFASIIYLPLLLGGLMFTKVP